MSLHTKSLVELRGIAQSMGVTDIFEKDAVQLAQAISLRQQDLLPKMDNVLPLRPEYDGRLLTKAVSKSATIREVEELLAPFVTIGMHLSFPEPDKWHMSHGQKEDTGTLRQPLRAIYDCAVRIMK